jgi:putative ABC transport system permease protein
MSGWVGDFGDDLRLGLRTLRKNPGFAVVAVVTLALGIGANTAIFSVVENVLLRPLPYVHAESLVEIRNTYPNFEPVGVAAGDYADWHREAKSFSAMGGYGDLAQGQGFNLTGLGEPERIQATVASSDLFSTLGIRAAAGRTFLPEEDKAGGGASVLLSHAYWQRRFGADPSVVGREIRLDGQRFRIVGVLPASFQILRSIEVWLPLPYYNGTLDDHIHHGITPIGRLRPGVTLAQAGVEIETLNRQEALAYPDSHKGWGRKLHCWRILRRRSCVPHCWFCSERSDWCC